MPNQKEKTPVLDFVPEAPAAPTGFGWLRDLPDFRDYTLDHKKVAPMVQKTRMREAQKGTAGAAPPSVDLRPGFSAIENQGSLGSCTAFAGVGLMEYMQRRAFGTHLDASPRFLYKATRNLLQWTGDTGAYLRTTMQAMRLFGVPPEKYWRYTTSGDPHQGFDAEPPAFAYSFAKEYQSVKYVRLDPPGTSKTDLLNAIKAACSSGIPAMFGFTVFSSITQAASTGKIPFPSSGDQVWGGHAVAVAGYDDTVRIRNAVAGSKESVGAFRIRNSWGAGWGESGYGWLPYDYVLSGMAVDWWTVLSEEFVDTKAFQ